MGFCCGRTQAMMLDFLHPLLIHQIIDEEGQLWSLC